jgi:DNA-binding NtrC family response regulator
MITANVLLEDTIAALRGGAYDFVGKPVNLNELQVTIRNGIEAGKLRKEAARAKAAAQKATDASLDEPFRLPPEGVQLESVEMSLVEQAMKRSGGNQTRAAEMLGISRDQLRFRLKKLEGAAVGALRNGSEI